MKRGIDYFRANSRTIYNFPTISVAVDPKSGPWITRVFMHFGQHGKVVVDMATCGGTPEPGQFKFWRFPVID